MIIAGIILAVAAIVIGLIWITAGERYCQCDYFVPNRHDDNCAVCRLPEDPEAPGVSE